MLLTLLLTSVTVVPFERIAPYLPEADILIGAIDPDDVPFVALALAEEHEGILSNDRAFERLPGIQCWTTTRLKTHLRLRRDALVLDCLLVLRCVPVLATCRKLTR